MDQQETPIVNFTKKDKFTYFDYINTYSSTPKFTVKDYNNYVVDHNKINKDKLNIFPYGKPKNYF